MGGSECLLDVCSKRSSSSDYDFSLLCISMSCQTRVESGCTLVRASIVGKSIGQGDIAHQCLPVNDSYNIQIDYDIQVSI